MAPSWGSALPNVPTSPDEVEAPMAAVTFEMMAELESVVACKLKVRMVPAAPPAAATLATDDRRKSASAIAEAIVVFFTIRFVFTYVFGQG